MINAKNTNPDLYKFTTRMIMQEMMLRGWKVWFYIEGQSYMRARRPDGIELELFSSVPPNSSFQACMASNNKYLSYLIQQQHKLPVLPTYVVAADEDGSRAFQRLRTAGYGAVVKPIDSSHGNGITTNISDPSDLWQALKSARKFSEVCLLQAQAKGMIDLRLLCIDYKLVAALIRIPARVLGDGKSTVKQLIELENQKPNRGYNYKKELNVIDSKAAKIYLSQKFLTIPKRGEWTQVSGVANVGMGGETQDVTAELPQWLKRMAAKVARSANLPCCGIDFLSCETPTVKSTQQELGVSLIEVNKSPSLFIHEMPTHGSGRPVVKQYVDYLVSL